MADTIIVWDGVGVRILFKKESPHFEPNHILIALSTKKIC